MRREGGGYGVRDACHRPGPDAFGLPALAPYPRLRCKDPAVLDHRVFSRKAVTGEDGELILAYSVSSSYRFLGAQYDPARLVREAASARLPPPASPRQR